MALADLALVALLPRVVALVPIAPEDCSTAA